MYSPLAKTSLKSTSDLNDIREYYGTVGRFLDLEQTKRNDSEFWQSLVRESDEPKVLELGAGNGRVTGS